MPKLIEQVREVLRMKHYSLRTEQAYVDWIKRYIFFHDKRHPADMSEAETRAFIANLARKKQVSSETQTVALSATVISLPRHPSMIKARLKAVLQTTVNVRRSHGADVLKRELPFIAGS